MKVFHVYLHGGPLTGSVDDRPQCLGFFKTESVLAQSAERAVEASMDRVRARLRELSSEFAVDWERLTMDVESVEEDFRYWRLLEQQGFVFYPIDESLLSDP